MERLVIRDGKFYVGNDRFIGWGGNVGPWFIVSSQKWVEYQISRARDFGINALRLHHLDSLNFPGFFARSVSEVDPLKRRHVSTQLDVRYMRSLDWLIYCCGRYGIRVMLDLFNRRQFTGADLELCPDLGPLFTEQRYPTQKGEAKSFLFLVPAIQEYVSIGNRAVLNHVNEFTGLAYKDDPIISWFMVCNEHDFVTHSPSGWPGDPNPPKTIYDSLWKDKFRRWNVPRGTKGTKYDIERFKADVEVEVFSKLVGDLDDLIGGRPVISHSYWGNSQFTALHSISMCSGIVDLHAYSRQKPVDPNIMSRVLDTRLWPSFESIVGSIHLDNKPMTITEWAPVYQGGHGREPIDVCVEAFEVVAKSCVSQDVDAAFLFTYLQGTADPLWMKDSGYEFGANEQLMNLFKVLSKVVVDPLRVSKKKVSGRVPEHLRYGYVNALARGQYVFSSPWNEAFVRDSVGVNQLRPIW